MPEGRQRRMEDWLARTGLLLGGAGVERLKRARVAVFGVGGVGGYAVEALARSGVGALDLIDNDVVAPSNINRQIIATVNNIGKAKVAAAAARVREINPACTVRQHRVFYLPETAAEFDFREYDYVVDAIDTVSGKLMLAEQAAKAGTPIISSMGAGNKLDPTAFRVADIYETKVCPLAKVMRRELRKRGIGSLKVVYSEEVPVRPKDAGNSEQDTEIQDGGGTGGGAVAERETECPGSGMEGRNTPRRPPGSVAFVPSVAGLVLAGEVIRDLCAGAETRRSG